MHVLNILIISGSGGSCGASSGSLYCGQALHVLNDQLVALQIPICDCTTPFAVNVVTGKSFSGAKHQLTHIMTKDYSLKSKLFCPE